MSRLHPILLALAALFVLSAPRASLSQPQTFDAWPVIAVPEEAIVPKARPLKARPVKAHTKAAAPKRTSKAATSTRVAKPAGPQMTAIAAEPKAHRVVIQVTQNDPALMTVALNNAENLGKYYQEKGERVQLEFVAYGPGLHMLRSDTSPVRDRIKSFAERNKDVTFSGCGNTLNAQSKQENKQLTLLPEARIVPAGIARITELQEQGWAYVRP